VVGARAVPTQEETGADEGGVVASRSKQIGEKRERIVIPVGFMTKR
jgi:hypothetical protein